LIVQLKRIITWKVINAWKAVALGNFLTLVTFNAKPVNIHVLNVAKELNFALNAIKITQNHSPIHRIYNAIKIALPEHI